MNSMQNQICQVLEECKASSILVINTEGKTVICDFMIIATAESSRQMQFIAQTLLRDFKKDRMQSNAETDENWTLIDLGDAIVHIMTPEARNTINLEEIWSKR
ncbi:ribosome silencing factor [Candidatus Comchoanobacter bicostacola]|uniref:Ribosomal silencing factor RsfS n=1 Tax=Candidatus Comchoanobacter bicostacola TaxID=2919598 RepID=A0ABY5DN43_9GAMM|nr:ribosome silencing factor [Candidatus Comchoanobacter bicostacola]UTC24955.1 ribosome silencing factor [Candidatus Comchoanobacter bicostacola]